MSVAIDVARTIAPVGDFQTAGGLDLEGTASQRGDGLAHRAHLRVQPGCSARGSSARRQQGLLASTLLWSHPLAGAVRQRRHWWLQTRSANRCSGFCASRRRPRPTRMLRSGLPGRFRQCCVGAPHRPAVLFKAGWCQRPARRSSRWCGGSTECSWVSPGQVGLGPVLGYPGLRASARCRSHDHPVAGCFTSVTITLDWSHHSTAGWPRSVPGPAPSLPAMTSLAILCRAPRGTSAPWGTSAALGQSASRAIQRPWNFGKSFAGGATP